MGNGVPDYELINEIRVCNSFQLARVQDTTIHLKSEERFANSSDSWKRIRRNLTNNPERIEYE
jgi:hypothetical protein